MAEGVRGLRTLFKGWRVRWQINRSQSEASKGETAGMMKSQRGCLSERERGRREERILLVVIGMLVEELEGGDGDEGESVLNAGAGFGAALGVGNAVGAAEGLQKDEGPKARQKGEGEGAMDGKRRERHGPQHHRGLPFAHCRPCNLKRGRSEEGRVEEGNKRAMSRKERVGRNRREERKTREEADDKERLRRG